MTGEGEDSGMSSNSSLSDGLSIIFVLHDFRYCFRFRMSVLTM